MQRIRGTRIPVELVLCKLSEGQTEAELLEDYPRLAREDIAAVLAYAADVIAHTRALVGKSNEERVSVDIGALIRDVLVLVRPEVARHRIDVSLSLADDLPPVPADRVQLQQVMLNLIVNGIEAMADVTDRSRELRLGVEPSEVDGKPAVVVVDVAEYERLQHLDRAKAPSFAELLLAMPRDGGEFPRRNVRPRDIKL